MSALRRHPMIAYFAAAYLISFGTYIAVVAPRLARGEAVPPTDTLLAFPVMVAGVAAVAVALTAALEGRRGLRALLARMRRSRVAGRWYAAAIGIPPALILATLTALSALVSSDFAPHLFVVGIGFGIIAGFFEEIGWTGFAYPRMRRRFGAMRAAAVLGVLWGLWHLPVIDSLGAAAPHGAAWLPFVAAFIAVVTAMRMLIGWIYVHSESVFIPQLMHASSTGSLVVFSPSPIAPSKEVVWYLVYAALLWAAVAVVARVNADRMLTSVSDG